MSGVLPSPGFDKVPDNDPKFRGYQRGRALVGLKRDLRESLEPAKDKVDVRIYNSLKGIEASRDQLNAKVSKVRQETLEKTTKKTHELHSLAGEFHEKLTEKEKLLGRVTSKIDKISKELPILKKERDELRAEVDKLDTFIKKKEAEHSQKKAQIAALKQELSELPKSLSPLKGGEAASALKQQKAQIDIEIVTLERQLDDDLRPSHGSRGLEDYREDYRLKSEEATTVNASYNQKKQKHKQLITAKNDLEKEITSIEQEGESRVTVIGSEIQTLIKTERAIIAESTKAELDYEVQVKNSLMRDIPILGTPSKPDEIELMKTENPKEYSQYVNTRLDEVNKIFKDFLNL